MNEQRVGRHPERIRREESAGRFLELFSSISGMKQSSGLEGLEIKVPPNAEFAGIVGAVIVGSSADPSGHPKDLDVILFCNMPTPGRPYDYAEELSSQFDTQFSILNGSFRPDGGKVEHGRLDVLGFIFKSLKNTHRDHLPRNAILRTESPIVLAYEVETARRIITEIEELRLSQ